MRDEARWRRLQRDLRLIWWELAIGLALTLALAVLFVLGIAHL